jgi:hypothetical protein
MDANTYWDEWVNRLQDLRADTIRLLQAACQILNPFDDFTLVISEDVINEIQKHTAILIRVLKTQEQRFE